MNRRASLKSIFLLAAAGFSTLSIYKFCSINRKFDVAILNKKSCLLAELAEAIIPRTDSPGSKDAHVEKFIIKMLEDCTEKKTQRNFIAGLIELEEYSVKNYHSTYLACSSFEKLSILKHFEDKSVYPTVLLDKINYKLFGKPFFTKLKELTVEGYCTSQIGATRGLRYDYNPGLFNACIPLTNNQKSWATK